MRQRLRSLERQRWFALAIFPLLTIFAFKHSPDDLTCSSLKVVNSDGRTLVLLGSDQGGGKLSVKNNGGMTGVEVSCFETGGAVEVCNSKAEDRVVLGVLDDCGRSEWFGTDTHKRATISASPKGKGELQLFDANQVLRSAMGFNDDGGYFVSNGSDGKARAFMNVDSGGDGAFSLYAGKDGKKRANIAIDEDGVGTVQVMDESGTVKGKLPN